ncbi:unnamed protein product [Brassica oleracea var. botrytis]|uniref:(rape) hypothetical protein n=1 Tax=Brassica napus TaxID=3708 RepID=A0A816MF93_BRANA|nr:unnamed protein product [Brassica napus]
MPYHDALKRLNCFVLFLNQKMVDHDYVEYNNSSITSSCQAHSPWLSA